MDVHCVIIVENVREIDIHCGELHGMNRRGRSGIKDIIRICGNRRRSVGIEKGIENGGGLDRLNVLKIGRDRRGM